MSKTGKSSGGKGVPSRPNIKNIIAFAVLSLFIIAALAARGHSGALKEVSLSEAIKNANAGKYSKIELINNERELQITEKGKQKPTLKAYKEQGASLKDSGINANKITVNVKPDSSTSSMIWSILPNIIFIALFA
ncbi:hypothetical protein KBC77_04185, partial [Candidatus Saccharibacteria bacterium]|nr:hypothetical protein [Candidatus Saccharibacteria bacterium]